MLRGTGQVRVVCVLDRFGLFDLVFGAVADKDGLASPLDDDVLALGDGGEVDLDFCLREHVGRGGHVF